MKRGVLRILLTLILWVSSQAIIPSTLAQPGSVPPPPQYYVLDEPEILSKPMLRALQALLVEHDTLTGEQLVIGIFNSLDGADPVAHSQQIFAKWQIGNRGKDNGALLTLFWKEHQSRLVVGFGLESILTDLKSEEILTDILKPELRDGHPDRALGLAALQLLKILDSPLVHDGKAQEILKSGGLSFHWDSQKSIPLGWPFWIVLGFLLLLLVLHLLTSADAHFSKHGWSRPRPWSRQRPPDSVINTKSSDDFNSRMTDSQGSNRGASRTEGRENSYRGGASGDW